MTQIRNQSMLNNLPYVERFRPHKLFDIMAQQHATQSFVNFLTTQPNLPNLLLYGPPGTGKTSTIESFVLELYGADYIDYMVLNINASEERGIDIVRNKIVTFAATLPVFHATYKKKDKVDNIGLPLFKFVILDEADAMTIDAQSTLRKVMENYTFNTRFCLICNQIKNIDDAIKSRCAMFKFAPIPSKDIQQQILKISNITNVKLTSDGCELIWKLSKGDMRKTLHILQIMSIINDSEQITVGSIASFYKYPTDLQINECYEFLCANKNIPQLIDYLCKLKHEYLFFVSDLLTELGNLIINKIIDGTFDARNGQKILQNMRDIEMNLISTSDSFVQLCALATIFFNNKN